MERTVKFPQKNLISTKKNLDNDRLGIFFIFSFWIVLFFLYAVQFPKWIELAQNHDIIKKHNLTQNQKEIKVLIENPKEKSEKEKKELVFLSNQEMKARGQLTKERGFEALTKDEELEWNTEKEQIQQKSIKTFTGRDFEIQLEKITNPLRSIENEIHKSQTHLKKIPTYYQFRDRFALSWNMIGSPRIPTKDFKHFDYFKAMLNKIKNNWAPPGGIPYPVYGDDYHSMSPAPGYTRFSSFPNQDVKIVFMIDDNGNVLDAKIHHSLGYQSLDQSLLDAIYVSRNFGFPPKELIQKGVVIIPIIFRIITH